MHDIMLKQSGLSQVRGCFCLIAAVAVMLVVPVMYHLNGGHFTSRATAIWIKDFEQSRDSSRDPGASLPIVSPSIFFMETSSDRSDLSLREVCSIESAARLHPTTPVILLYRNPSMVDGTNVALLRRFTNFRLHRMAALNDMFADTPLDGSPVLAEVEKGEYRREHMSDALRYAVLWRHGGIYLDTDVVVKRPLTDLGNSLGRVNGGGIGTSTMIFEPRHPFLQECMLEYENNYDPNNYAANGPLLLARVHKRFCQMTPPDTRRCAGITVHPVGTFSPIAWQEWMRLFLPLPFSHTDVALAYSVHMYGHMSRNFTSTPGSGTLIEMIARENCPFTFERMLTKNEI